MPAPTPIETDLATIFASAPTVTIKTAVSLTGTWTQRDHLYLDSLRDSAGPAIGMARMTWFYGDVLHPGDTEVAVVAPLEINGLYVWISMTHDNPDIEDPDDWYGVIEIDDRTPHGTIDGVPSGVQHFTAYDLKRMWEKYQVTTSTIETSDGISTQEINEGLTFNTDRRGEFSAHGNRADNIYPGTGAEADAYVFSYKEREQSQWTALNAVNYLLTHVAPKMFPDVTWYLDVTSGNLNWNPKGAVHTDRKTFKSIIDELISRQRGVGYYLVFDPVAESITVNVFSFSDVAIAMPDGTTFDANPNQFSLDFEQAFDIERCQLTNTQTTHYHKIIVEGARKTSTCSLRVDTISDEFIRDWDSSELNAYATAASGEVGYGAANRETKNRWNEAARNSDLLKAVFRRFRLSDLWLETSVDPLNIGTDSIVFPEVSATDPDGVPSLINSDPIWIDGLQVLDKLTLRQQYDYSGSHIPDEDWTTTVPTTTEPPFLDPFCFMKTNVPATDDWEMLDKIDGAVAEKAGKRRWYINTRSHHDRAAITLDVQGGPQHFFGKTEFLAATPAVYDAKDDPATAKNYGLDYDDSWVTVTLQSQQRVSIEKQITTPETGEQERVLRIQAPDCRLDYVVPNTVVAVDKGDLKQTDGGFVRDDRQRLANFAEAAALWYGRERQTLDLSFKQVRRVVGIGDLIVDVGATYQKTNINSVVSAITYDMRGLTTQWETAFAEMDQI